MDDKKMDEKLALLKKSYDRMPQHLDVDALMQKIDDEEKAAAIPVVMPRKKKWGIWAVTAAALFTAGVLVSPTILQQDEGAQTQQTAIENRALIDTDVAVFTQSDITEEKVKEAIEGMRQSLQQTLALDDEQFNALPFVQAGDGTAQFYMTKRLDYVLEQQGFAEMFERLDTEYRTPSQFIREIELAEGRELDYMTQFLERMPQLEAAYTEAYKEATTTERRNELIVAAKEEGIYFTEDVAHFNYDKFAEVHEYTLNEFGLLQGFIIFAHFDGTLYEADDLRYAPDELLPYFNDITTALLSVDDNNTWLLDTYIGEYLIAVLRLLQGTEHYPLNEETVTYFTEGAQRVFAPVASRILKELELTGSSATAAALTYDELEALFNDARLSTTGHVIEETTWTPTELDIASMNEKWKSVPSDFLTYDVVDTVLYYMYAQQHDVTEVIEVIEANDVTYFEGMPLETISSMRILTYSPALVEVYVYGEEPYMMQYRFEHTNGHWQRTK